MHFLWRNSSGKDGKSEKNRKFATYFAVVSIDAGKSIENKLNQNNKKMQSKGWIRFVAIMLGIASIWQLSFTAVTRYQENKAAKYAEAQAQQFVEANNVPAEILEYVKDSVANNINRAYIDSLNNEKVYLWYLFKNVKEKEINLGLDLKGGMNVMLQVQLEDLVKALSGNSTDPDFVAAMNQAKAKNVNSSADFIGLFADAWEQVAPQRRLAEIFATFELRDKVANDATNAQHPAGRQLRQDPHRTARRERS